MMRNGNVEIINLDFQAPNGLLDREILGGARHVFAIVIIQPRLFCKVTDFRQ